MELLILSAILAAACAAPMQQSLSVRDDGSYQFFYETGPDGGQHSRTEVRHPDGVVVGKYSYEDANGAIREVNYRADDQGYVEGGQQVPAAAAPVKEEEEPSSSVASSVVAPDEEPQPEESVAVETKPDEEESPKTEDKEELSLEEPSADDPPEAFPPGFFLQNFHGLRRLPEPTTEEDKPVPSTEAPKVEEPPQEDDNETEPQKAEESKGGEKALSGDASFFPHLRPFQSFAPQPMDTSMFRAPVYVFSYQHPDSYGYHYVF